MSELLSDPDAPIPAIEPALRERGIEPDPRAVYNIRALGERLGIADPRRLLEGIEGASDPSLALNGLERIIDQLDDAGAARLRDAAVRSRLYLLCGAGEPFAELVLTCLADLEKTEFPALAREPLAPVELPDTEEVHARVRALSRWHRRELLRICLAELEGILDVEATAEALTTLADRAVEAAFEISGG